MNCITCQYVFLDIPHPEKPVYKCRRFPPSHDFTAGYPNRIGLFPAVKDGYFCGEYAPKRVVSEASSPIECDDLVRIPLKRGRPKKIV